jgi:Leucine-rich repeat (LRR) protein
MTSLASIIIDACKGFMAGSSLPENLPALELRKTPLPPGTANLLKGLEALTMLDIPTQPPAVWGQLRALTNLQDLYLSYNSLESAAAAAPVWGDLPSLQTLEVRPASARVVNGHMEVEDLGCLPSIVSKLASATSLQRLTLDMGNSSLPCGIHLANLTGLQTLHIHMSKAGKEDLLQLTKLSQLTHLSLLSVEIDDALFACLVGNLTKLQSLVILRTSLSIVALVIIAYQLKSLQSLQLGFTDAVTDESLPYLLQLTKLAQLTSLHFAPKLHLSQVAFHQFSRALPKCSITQRI